MPEATPDTIWGHLTELIKRLKIVIYVFIIATIVALVLPGSGDFFGTTGDYQPLISVFLRFVRNMALPDTVKLIALQVSDPIELYMMGSLFFSACVTFPVLAYEVYKFVNPALEANEKKSVMPFLSIVTILFVAGAMFGFFILFPLFINAMFPFFTAVGAELMFSIMDFYNMLFFTLIVSGVLFTIPAFFVLLVKFGILHTKTFKKKRRYIYLGLVVIAMLISPGAAPQANLFLFIALAILFELSLMLGKRFEVQPAFSPIKFRFKNMCKVCKFETDSNSAFCPQCRRATK